MLQRNFQSFTIFLKSVRHFLCCFNIFELFASAVTGFYANWNSFLKCINKYLCLIYQQVAWEFKHYLRICLWYWSQYQCQSSALNFFLWLNYWYEVLDQIYLHCSFTLFLNVCKIQECNFKLFFLFVINYQLWFFI